MKPSLAFVHHLRIQKKKIPNFVKYITRILYFLVLLYQTCAYDTVSAYCSQLQLISLELIFRRFVFSPVEAAKIKRENSQHKEYAGKREIEKDSKNRCR